ncbi:MAG: hypothetical protein H6600_06495 [Flavobacteriales bacterium]|nr:hypothetical protein [Flavobacteriales bacterium]
MKCKQCNNELIGKREDALYCNHNCQQKYFKRKKRILNQIQDLENEIKSNNETIEHLRNKSKNERDRLNIQLRQLNAELKPIHKKLIEINRVLGLSFTEFRRELIQAISKEPLQYWSELDTFKYGNQYEQREIVDRYVQRFRFQRKTSLQEYKLISTKRTKTIKELEKIDDEFIKNRIMRINTKNFVLQQKLDALREINVDRLPPIIKNKSIKTNRIKNSGIRAYSGQEILSLDFESIKLNGNLGDFIGKLIREKCAIALTGDSGAGKSTFSFQLAEAFLSQKLSVAYFSLEAGFTESMKGLIKKFSLNRSNFSAFDDGGLKEVRSEASNFDCVVIDSYSKISAKAIDFENLRQDFPNTIFIVIFQKTTDGKIRGGSSILYNSTATIDIKVTSSGKRIAIMQKSRYGTENFVYSISENKLIKDDKLPIDKKKIGN